MLNAYRAVHPDLPETIVRWTEMQMSHRHALELASMRGAELRMNRGQILTFSATLAGLVLSAVVGVMGSAVVASLIAIVAVGGPTAAFILARTLDWNLQRPHAAPAKTAREPRPPA